MCSIPDCDKKSEINFSLVRVCKPHFAQLYEESLLYYNGSIHYRPIWETVKSLVPKKVVSEEDVYGRDCIGGKCDV